MDGWKTSRCFLPAREATHRKKIPKNRQLQVIFFNSWATNDRISVGYCLGTKVVDPNGIWTRPLARKKWASKILQEIGGGIWATPKKKLVANFSLR